MSTLRNGISLADVEYGVALLDENSGQYWSLNPTGALVLETLLAGGTLGDAAEKLANQFAVDLPTADQDVQDLIGALRSAGLLDDSA